MPPPKENKEESGSSLRKALREEEDITAPDVILSLLSLCLRFTFPANKSQSANTKQAKSRRLWNDIHAAAEAVAM